MGIDRRTFIGTMLSGLATSQAGRLLAEQPTQPSAHGAPAIIKRKPRKNVLFIGVDDLNTGLGCYGHPLVKSPNLDKLAARGVRFDRAYCQFPWCSPSRSSLMTGKAPDTTGVYELETHFRKALPNVVTLPQLFRENGYRSLRVGKIYHASDPGGEGTDGLDDPISWDWTFNPAGVDHWDEESLVTNYTPTRGGLGSAIAFHRSPAADNQITDGIGADKVISLLEQHRQTPFFMAYGLYRPHVPWIVPSKYFDMYPLDRIEPVPFDPSELTTAPPAAYWTEPPNFGMDIDQRKHALQGYFAATTYMDAQVGKVLDSLNHLGLAENTLVVFWADHGWQTGQHGQWMKQTLFENAARVPVIFAGPGVSSHGKACYRTIEHLDTYPTVAELCELEHVPESLHGESLVTLLKDPGSMWSKSAITQMQRLGKGGSPAIMGYSIRNERYRYTTWDEGRAGEELYDYQTDPRELKNLAKDPGAARVKFEMAASLNATTRSRGRVPAGPARRGEG